MYDIPKLKTEINLFARALHEQNIAFKQAQREHLPPWGQAPSDEIADKFEALFPDTPGRRGENGIRQFRSNSGYWLWGAVSIYFTRLCALRASMRERLHFSERTKEATTDYLGIDYPITLEAQRQWAEVIAHRYELAEEPRVRAAG